MGLKRADYILIETEQETPIGYVDLVELVPGLLEKLGMKVDSENNQAKALEFLQRKSNQLIKSEENPSPRTKVAFSPRSVAQLADDYQQQLTTLLFGCLMRSDSQLLNDLSDTDAVVNSPEVSQIAPAQATGKPGNNTTEVDTQTDSAYLQGAKRQKGVKSSSGDLGITTSNSHTERRKNVKKGVENSRLSRITTFFSSFRKPKLPISMQKITKVPGGNVKHTCTR